MSRNLKESATARNLMRAFAGESQARNRYTLAASQAREQGLYVIEAVFNYTAGQEKEHAEVFYGFLSSLAGENIEIDGSYPVDVSQSVAELLRYAEHNELEEYGDVYKGFGDRAMEEGFPEIAAAFYNIAEIERTHADRFSCFAGLLERGCLFVNHIECEWVCLNCGHIHKGSEAPQSCPVCHHERGYFIRLTMSPWKCN